MRFLQGAFILTALLFSVVGLASELLGTWNLDRYRYDGTDRKVNHTLMNLHFEEDIVGLFWKEKEQTDFCERKAIYIYMPPQLYQKVNWVNPENAIDCHNDKDMQLGTTTANKIEIIENELFLYLALGDHEMIYIFKKAASDSTTINEPPQ